MAKEGEFGGFPSDELDKLLANWGSTARPASLTDPVWIGKLVDKVNVLAALVKEEHAAANAGDRIDLVSVVMKCISVREKDQNVVGGGSVSDLVGAIGDLEKEWGG
jgi:hypothetical protein